MIPRDSFVTAPAEIRRAMSAARRILARLQDGPASMQELIAITPKYTQRVSDLRKAGYDVRCLEDPVTGTSLYRLVTGSASERTTTSLRASVPSDESEAQDLRGVPNEKAPHDCNGFQLR